MSTTESTTKPTTTSTTKSTTAHIRDLGTFTHRGTRLRVSGAPYDTTLTVHRIGPHTTTRLGTVTWAAPSGEPVLTTDPSAPSPPDPFGIARRARRLADVWAQLVDIRRAMNDTYSDLLKHTPDAWARQCFSCDVPAPCAEHERLLSRLQDLDARERDLIGIESDNIEDGR